MYHKQRKTINVIMFWLNMVSLITKQYVASLAGPLRASLLEANYLLIHLKTLFKKNFSNSKIIAAGESKHHVLRMFNNTWTTRSGEKVYIMSHLPVKKNYHYTLKNHMKKDNKKNFLKVILS